MKCISTTFFSYFIFAVLNQLLKHILINISNACFFSFYLIRTSQKFNLFSMLVYSLSFFFMKIYKSTQQILLMIQHRYLIIAIKSSTNCFPMQTIIDNKKSDLFSLSQTIKKETLYMIEFKENSMI